MSTTTLSLGPHGSLSGLSVSHQVHRYLNVPYALPPTGEHRWRRPRTLPKDFTFGERDATQFGKICPQPVYAEVARLNGAVPITDPDAFDEDCLVLNIWKPAGEPPKDGWPVFIWIHGGWLQVGNPLHEPFVDPTELVNELQIVVVAVGYRVSVLGFLAGAPLREEATGPASETEHGAFGNYGLWDQRLAIEWVHEYIKYFGGDAGRVTIAGLSAGAYSVHAQTFHDFFQATPSSPPLFHNLIQYSNAIPTQPKTVSDAQPQFEELLSSLGISLDLSGAEQLAALRAVRAKALVDKVMTLKMHTFRAVTDGVFISEGLRKRYDDGSFAKRFKERGIRLLIGETQNEETIYRQTNPPADFSDLHTEISNYYPSHIADKLITLYRDEGVHLSTALPDPDAEISDVKKLFGDIVSDGQVRAPARLLLSALRDGGVPLSRVWRYRVDYLPTFIRAKREARLGVGHAFDNPMWNYSVRYGPTEEEAVLMRQWIDILRGVVCGGDAEFGTEKWEEMKVLTKEGKIEVQKDTKWDYLLKVAEQIFV